MFAKALTSLVTLAAILVGIGIGAAFTKASEAQTAPSFDLRPFTDRVSRHTGGSHTFGIIGRDYNPNTHLMTVYVRDRMLTGPEARNPQPIPLTDLNSAVETYLCAQISIAGELKDQAREHWVCDLSVIHERRFAF